MNCAFPGALVRRMNLAGTHICIGNGGLFAVSDVGVFSPRVASNVGNCPVRHS